MSEWMTEARLEVVARTKRGEGFIYIAECGPHKVKIGHSLNPQRRMATLYGGVDCTPVRLLAAIPGSLNEERALHKTLEADVGRPRPYREFYDRAVLSHPAIPADLRHYQDSQPKQKIVWVVSFGKSRVNCDSIDEAATALATHLRTGLDLAGSIERLMVSA